MNPLLEIEGQVPEEGREWTRRRLQERLQSEADSMGSICPHSGLLLKDVRQRTITLRTCVGEVSVQAAYGYSSFVRCWLSPARVRWGLGPCQRVSPKLQQRVGYTATKTGSVEGAAAMAACWGNPVSDDLVRNHVAHIAERARRAPAPTPKPAPERQGRETHIPRPLGWAGPECQRRFAPPIFQRQRCAIPQPRATPWVHVPRKHHAA